MVAAGTPDHNKCPLPLAFASFEPHHDQGARRADSSLPRHRLGARHLESQTRRHPQRYETELSRNTPHIINQAHMGGRLWDDPPLILLAVSGLRCTGSRKYYAAAV